MDVFLLVHPKRSGGCPHCRKNDGYITFFGDFWFVCDTHKMRWRVPPNLVTCWSDELEDEPENKEAIAAELEGYAEVEPIFHSTIRILKGLW